jgi:hypothetical protein
MKVALFLGSGASVPFAKPTTDQLKTLLKGQFSSPEIGGQLDFVRELLVCEDFVDFEYVLQAAKDIESFLNTNGGAFFNYLGRKPALVFYKKYSQQEPINFNLYIKDWKDVVKKLEDLVFQYYTWNHSQDHNLRTIYDYIFATLKNHSEEITIFTTNYDKAIEIYCNRAGYQLVDGFWKNGDDYIWKDGEFYYPAITSIDEVKKHVYLYKLHGSLNWKKHIMGVIMRATEEGKSSDPNIKDNLLIYPTLSPKTDSGEPFNTIFREFNAKMNNVDVCVVIGFSFRDNDINETFRDFARSNPTTGRKKIIVISPSAQQDYAYLVLKI